MNKYIRYAGLIRNTSSNNEKQALVPFGSQYVANYPGIGKTRFVNRYGSENIGGQVSLKGEFDFMASGDTTWLVKNLKHTARTELEKTVHNGTKIKHHDWDGIISNWKMDNTNFSTFSDFEEHNAKFKETNTGVITIKNNLISAGGSDKGKIQFRDPWYVENETQPDIFKEYSSPFTPGGGDYAYYDGIFLSQSYLEAAHYSVKASSVQTVKFHNEDITWYFQNWAGTNVDFESSDNAMTGVKFNTANCEIKANYKGHLASSVARATGYNNGRRMARLNSNDLYMVYEDGSQIWFTSSSDGGASWQKDERIYAYYPQTNPAVSVNSNGISPSVHVVYETLVPKGSDYAHVITYQHKGENGWEAPEYLDGYFGTTTWIGGEGERPVIVSESWDNIYIAWRDKSSGKIKVIYKSPSNGWSPIRELGGTNGYPVIGRTASGTRKTKIIWSDGNDIKYTECEYTGSYWMTYSTYNMTGWMSYSNDKNPTMSIDANGIAHVSWEAEHNGYGSRDILYQKYDVSNGISPSGSLYSIYATYLSNELGNASIAYDQNISLPVTVFYQSNGNIERVRGTGNGNGWSQKSYSGGRYPSISRHSSDGAVWTKYNDAPYILTTDYTSGALNKTGDAASSAEKPLTALKRFDFQMPLNRPDSLAFVSLRLNSMYVNGESLTFSDALKSQKLELKGSDYIEIDWDVMLKDLPVLENNNDILLEVNFESTEGKKTLERYTVNDIIELDNGNGTSGFFYSSVGSERGAIVIDFGEIKPMVVTVLEARESAMPFFEKQGIEQNEEPVPNAYYLNANYPNPFNPITHIAFGLPQSVPVRLEVFNLSGQRVALLVDKTLAAGRYDVAFDGSGLASGTYIYRLRAGNAFVQSRKLLLVK